MPSFSEWVVNSWTLHKNLSYELGSRVWDEFIYPEEENHLFQKIAVAFYGEPKSSADNLGLEEKHEKTVRSIIEKCLKYSYDRQKIKIAIIFVSIYKNKSFATDMPLIRVMTFHSKQAEDVPKSKFIDIFGRVYDNLKNFIDTNTWENSYICFPKNGYYKMDLTICLKKPEIKDEVLEVADKVSNVVNIGTSASMLVGIGMSLFPPTAPIGMLVAGYSAVAGAPGAVYGVGRSVGKIIDRSVHEQSISLLDSEARQCWLVTASAVASMGALASTKILSSMATSGRVVSTTARGACTGVNLASVGLSGISVVNSAYELSQKEGEVTSLEIIQLTTSILFLTHSVVSFKTAKTIIQEAQQNEIARMRSSVSPEHQEKYNSILKNTRRSMNKKTIPSSERNMLGQAEFIRKMKKIDNPNEYFSNFKITSKGNYCLNKKLSITPKKFQNLSEHERQTLLNSSKDLQDRKISLKAFNKKVQPIVKKYKIFVRKGVKPQNNQNTGNTNKTRISNNTFVYSDSKSEKNENTVGFVNSRDTRLINLIKMAATKIMSIIKALKDKHHGTKINFEQIMRIIVEKIESEVNRRFQENSNPPRSSETDPKEHYLAEVSKDFQTEGHPLNLYLNSLLTLIVSCKEANIKIPKRCFEIILDMVEQNIQNVLWLKNDNIFQCSFTSENCTDYKVEIHFIETECVVYLYEVRRTLIERARIYDMNNFVSKVDSHIRAYLTDLETSCKEENIQIPRKCLEVLLEKSQGKPHNVKWNKSDNFIESSFSTSSGEEMTVDFHINNNKFITNSYKNSCHLIDQRVCELTIEEKGETDSEGEDDSDDEGDDSLQFLAYLVRKLSAKKEANEIVDILIRRYSFQCLTKENMQIIKDFTSNKIMEMDFKMRNNSSIYNKFDSSVMGNDYLASVIHRECLSRGSSLNVCLTSFIYLVISYQRNHISTPKQCLEFIMEKVKGEITLNRISWSRNTHIVECHYNSLSGNNIKMNFEVIDSNLVAKYIDDNLDEIKVYDLNVEEEYPEYLLDNDDTSGL